MPNEFVKKGDSPGLSGGLSGPGKGDSDGQLPLSLSQSEQFTLAGYVRALFNKMQQEKKATTDRFMRSAEQRNGIYNSTKSSALKLARSSEIFVRITANKCRAAEAWIKDVLAPTNDKPWALEPSGYPDVPREVLDKTYQKAEEDVRLLSALYSMSTGQKADPEEYNRILAGHKEETRERTLQLIRDMAKQRAERMEQKVGDQLLEGGFPAAFDEVISDLVTYGVGILKGPVFRVRKEEVWDNSATGETSSSVVKRVSMEFERVSPFDFYWEDDAPSWKDSAFIHRQRFTRKEMQSWIDLPGFDAEAVKSVLIEHGEVGVREFVSTDMERKDVENRARAPMSSTNKIDVLEFTGSVQGKLIRSLMPDAAPGSVEDHLDYDVVALVCESRVLRVMMNPNPLGEGNFSIGVCEKIPGSLAGNGIPSIIEDPQDACNAFARAMINNAAYASGPMFAVNVDMVEEEGDSDVFPLKTFRFSNKDLQGGKPVEMLQTNMQVEPLIASFKHFSALCDEHSGIPAYSYGMPGVKGTGGTASGLSMLMGGANRGIKQMIRNIDTGIIQPTVARVVSLNNALDPDDSIKGDIKVVARGANALISKEIMSTRRQEFVNLALSNPVAQQIVGLGGIAKMMREGLKSLETNPDDIIPIREVEALDEMRHKQILRMSEGSQSPGGQAPQPPKSDKGKDVRDTFAGGSVQVGGDQSGPTASPKYGK